MNWAIEFSKQAQEELKSHLNYYETQVPGLSEQLSEELAEHLLAIVLFPHAQVRYDQVRCIPLRRFPYMIHFSVIETRHIIRVQAIVHTSRNPNKHWNSDDWIVSENTREYIRQVSVLEFE